jgi:hypothetical protein
MLPNCCFVDSSIFFIVCIQRANLERHHSLAQVLLGLHMRPISWQTLGDLAIGSPSSSRFSTTQDRSVISNRSTVSETTRHPAPRDSTRDMRTYLAGLGLGLSIASYHTLHHRPIRLDGPVALSSSDFHTKSAPSLGLRRTQLNPATVREISGGSIIGKITSPSPHLLL